MARVNDCENISEFANILGNYYRFINYSNSREIHLKDEIEHCMNYIKIQSVRFKGRIKVDLNYDESNIKNINVPYLILQPIIENAYEHGLANVSNHGMINIDIRESGQYLLIQVEDNGKSMSDSELMALQEKLKNTDSDVETSGMININRRLKIKYGGR